MFFKKKRIIAFIVSVCCLVTMVWSPGIENGSAAVGQDTIDMTKNLSATGAVAAVMTNTAKGATSPAFVSTPPAFDVNDAQYMGISQLYSFTTPASQSALYYFTTTSTKAYYQVRAFVTSGSAFHVEIYDTSATNLVGSADLTNGAYTRFALEESRRYYLRVTGENYISGSVMMSSVRDDFQDTRGAAGAISFNKQYAVTTDIAGDVDYLKFTIGNQDATYYLTTEPTAGNSGTYELQDSSGKKLSAYSGTTNKNTTIKKKLSLAKNKTYYLKISSKEAYRQVVVSVSRTINQYRIYYHLNGGSNNKANPSVYVATNTIKLKNPKRKGYTFVGWYTTAKFKGKIATIKGTAKKTYHLYAKWKKVSVKKISIKSFVSTKKGRAKVTFKKQSGVKGYKIRIGLSSKLKKKTKTYVKKTTTVEFKKLKPGKKYYIAVCAFKTDSAGKRVYGSYSKTKSAKVKSKTTSKKKESSKSDSKKSKTKKSTSKKSTTKKTTSKKDTSKKSTTKKATTKKSTTKKTTTKKSTSKKSTTKKTTSKKTTTKKSTSKK